MLGVSTRFARAAGLSWVALRALLEIERFPARVSFAPSGLGELFRELTQGLRPGLHSFAASRLELAGDPLSAVGFVVGLAGAF
jgi:hypothetical protein